MKARCGQCGQPFVSKAARRKRSAKKGRQWRNRVWHDLCPKCFHGYVDRMQAAKIIPGYAYFPVQYLTWDGEFRPIHRQISGIVYSQRGPHGA